MLDGVLIGVDHDAQLGELISPLLDLFGGSGSTLIACERTNRVCFMMELDEQYCDVIRKRYWMSLNDGDDTGWADGTAEVA